MALHHTVPSEPETKRQQPHENFWGELLRFAAIAIVIVLPIRLFIAQPYVVAGVSMLPTFQNGDYLIADRISYRFEEPERGDVIIFHYPRDTQKAFIKRIIALPNETIDIRGDAVFIENKEHPEGFELDEKYIAGMDEPTHLRQKLGPDEYFVLGDNRDESSDSRTWGVLDRRFIIGRALLRLLPINEIDVFPGKATPDTTA